MQINSVVSPLEMAYSMLQFYVSTDSLKKLPESYILDRAKAWDHLDLVGQRIEYRNVIEYHINRVTSEYKLERCNILEIGSGKIDFGDETQKNESFLSAKIPHQCWTFSDYCPAPELKNPNQYIQLDLLKTTSKVNASFDCIVGSNVLDMLPYGEIAKAFTNIYQRLNKNGLFIHYAGLAFFEGPFLHAAITKFPNSIFLPAVCGTVHRVYKINRNDFQEILQKKKNTITPLEFEVLNYWGSQRVLLQAFSIKTLHQKILQIYEKENTSRITEKFEQLISRIEEIFSSHLEKISSEELFIEALTQAAVSKKFRVEKCTFDELIELIDVPPNKEGAKINKKEKITNYFELTQTICLNFRCYVLAPDKNYMKLRAHFFIARKID